MELTRCLRCECSPDFKYSSPSTFAQHKKSKKHLAWEAGGKSDKAEATRRDNEIFTLKLKLRRQEEATDLLRAENQKIRMKNVEQRCEILKLYEIHDNLMDKLKKAKRRIKDMVLNFGTAAVPDLISL